MFFQNNPGRFETAAEIRAILTGHLENLYAFYAKGVDEFDKDIWEQSLKEHPNEEVLLRVMKQFGL